MLNNIKKFFGTDNFSYFIRYLAVFTLIFVSMTVIILQVMRGSIYDTADENFEAISNDHSLLITFAKARGFEDGTLSSGVSPEEEPFDLSSKLNLNANYHVILFDEDGNVLNQLERLSGLTSLEIDLSDLDTISETTVETSYGTKETYRMMTVKMTSDEISDLTGLDVCYATILFNTTQLKASLSAYKTIVIVVMISFWFISIFASLYLSKLSVQPIMASYQKQKEFVENASHELRTPLAVLQNRLESLFRKPDATIMESSESIGSSLEEVRNMRLLTTNLLNLARRDDGLKAEIREVPVSFFDECFANFSMVAEENGKELTAKNNLKQAFPSDKVLLKQLMTILFDNAMKYSGDDGHIQIEVGLKDRHLMLTVVDDGIGISDADKKKVFDRFYRVDKARTRQKGGFGLGLSLAKQIIDSLNGTISVRDNHPKGTIFEVRLPR